MSYEVMMFQLQILKAVRLHVEFMFYKWLTVNQPFIPNSSEGTIESSTFPRPVPGSHWRTCEVTTLYLENCVKCTTNLRLLSG